MTSVRAGVHHPAFRDAFFDLDFSTLPYDAVKRYGAFVGGPVHV